MTDDVPVGDGRHLAASLATLPVDEVVETLGTTLEHGLESSAANRRLVEDGPNALAVPTPPGFLSRLWREMRAPMSVLLLVAAAVSAIFLADVVDSLVILAIVLLNATIGATQEGRAAEALEALRALETSSALVKRDGSWRPVDASQLVAGDVVSLRSGDRVPADLRLATADSLEVDEAMLTGESLPSSKTVVPAGDSNQLTPPTLAFSGTFIVRGSGVGVVTATGARTAIGEIASALGIESPPTPLQDELTLLTKRLGLGALVVSIGVFALLLGLDTTASMESAFLVSVALAVAAVPEGLPTVVTVGLALGVRRMAARGAIVRRLPAVETLGCASALLTDKTGTLTENRLVVERVVSPLGDGFRDRRTLRRAHAAMLLCNDAGPTTHHDDPVDAALRDYVKDIALLRLVDRTRRLRTLPFDEARRRMTVVVSNNGDDQLLVTKGAPEEVIPRCTHYLDADGATRPLTVSAIAEITDRVDAWASIGSKVIALADQHRPTRIDEDELDETDLVLVSLVGLHDPLRSTAPDAISNAKQAGIDVIMVTGDHPGTAKAIAGAAGIQIDDMITGPQLAAGAAPTDHLASIYARMRPSQKLDLVQAAQRAGHVVAVTGDGVNDAPALQRADIGVAMGRRGSDVAKGASDLVIVDDDLSTIVAAIKEGRGIYDNVKKVVEYLVAGNLSEIAVVLTALVAMQGVTLTAIQLLWINLLTDGLPALAVGVDPVSDAVMARPPRSRSERLLSGRGFVHLAGRAIILAGGPIAAMFVTLAGGSDTSTVRTVLFSSLVVAHLLYVFAVRQRHAPRNALLVGAVVLALVLQATVVLLAPLAALFELTTLDPANALLVVLAGAAPVASMFGWRAVRQRLGR